VWIDYFKHVTFFIVVWGYKFLHCIKYIILELTRSTILLYPSILEQFQQVSFFHVHTCVHSICTVFTLPCSPHPPHPTGTNHSPKGTSSALSSIFLLSTLVPFLLWFQQVQKFCIHSCIESTSATYFLTNSLLAWFLTDSWKDFFFIVRVLHLCQIFLSYSLLPAFSLCDILSYTEVSSFNFSSSFSLTISTLPVLQNQT
jgi:hypothetical protein